jgi:hypothetical protein
MRHFSLPCSLALSLARDSRPLISPNAGFERQLRVWEQCKYDIYLAGSIPSGSPKEKAAYRAWKSQRDTLLNQGEEAVNKVRFSSMASMAAEFGRRRLERKAETVNKNRVQDDVEGSKEEEFAKAEERNETC